MLASVRGTTDSSSKEEREERSAALLQDVHSALYFCIKKITHGLCLVPHFNLLNIQDLLNAPINLNSFRQ